MKFIKTLSNPLTNEEKNERKVVYITSEIHKKISLISSLTGISKVQITHNVLSSFIEENEDDIKYLINLKKKQLFND